MIEYLLILHIMIADPTNNIPKVYDYWFEDKSLRHYKTEKDCIKKANEIMEWSKAHMEEQKLTVIQQWFDCIEMERYEKASLNHKPRGYKAL
jgi:hypothetical protein